MTWLHALHKETTAGQVTPQRFFDEIVPRVLAARGDIAKKLGGTYGFHVDGAGDWVIDFAHTSVSSGDAHAAGLWFDVHADALTKLFAGTLDLQAAHSEGHFDVDGDASLLPRFTAVFRPR
jgi:hypothetical protein